MVDSGLLAHLLGADERRIAGDDQVTGKTLENFVVTEVLKHADWSQIDTTAYHYRQREEEIDLVGWVTPSPCERLTREVLLLFHARGRYFLLPFLA
jgi:hypothetical protein